MKELSEGVVHEADTDNHGVPDSLNDLLDSLKKSDYKAQC
jgi:hypothetical protein